MYDELPVPKSKKKKREKIYATKIQIIFNTFAYNCFNVTMFINTKIGQILVYKNRS